MSVLRASIIYAFANFASAGVPFLLLPVLTRVLGPSEYGLVVSFGMIVTFCGSLAGLSVHAALGVAWFNRPREQLAQFAGTALALAMISTLCVVPLVALALHSFPQLGAGIGPTWGAVAAVAAGCNVILQCRLVLWQSQQKPTPYAALQFASSVLNIGLSLIAVLVLGFGADGRNGGTALALLVMAGGAIWLLHRAGEAKPSFARADFLALVLFGLPLMPHALAGVLLATTDRWIVSVKMGNSALGVYGAIAQLGMAMAILADAFGKAINPWIYGKLRSETAGDRERAVGAVYASIPGFLLIAGAVGVIVYLAAGLMLGERYQAARHLIPWFMLGGAFSGVYICVSGLYFFSGKTGRLALVTSVTATTGVGLSWVFVSAFGVEGAAIAYAATQSLLAIATLGVAIFTFNLPWSRPSLDWSSWRRRSAGADL